jgi:hypothetical protein
MSNRHGIKISIPLEEISPPNSLLINIPPYLGIYH